MLIISIIISIIIGLTALGWAFVLRQRLQGEVVKRKLLEKQLKQQKQLSNVGQLAAGIAHDFNNIMSNIIGRAELIRLDSTLPKATEEDLNQIIYEGQRAAYLVRQLLDLSRKAIAEKKPLNLTPILEKTINDLQKNTPDNIAITLEVEPNDYTLQVDRSQIQQLVTNLISNARDAMPMGGNLRCGLSTFTLKADDLAPCPQMHPGDWIVLFVSDTGVGIPPEALPRLYEPFFTTKKGDNKSGLGLAQVYGIVKQHKGKIDVNSQVGKGTTFTVYLPRPVNKAQPQPENGFPKPLPGHGKTLLLVEDEPLVLKITQAMLTRLGYQVLTANGGREALEIYAHHQESIALVLTDLTMPDIQGADLAGVLAERNPDVKIVALTGYPLEKNNSALSAPGIVGWAEKPLGLEQLEQIVSRWV